MVAILATLTILLDDEPGPGVSQTGEGPHDEKIWAATGRGEGRGVVRMGAVSLANERPGTNQVQTTGPYCGSFFCSRSVARYSSIAADPRRWDPFPRDFSSPARWGPTKGLSTAR